MKTLVRIAPLTLGRVRASVSENLYRLSDVDFTRPNFIRACVTERCNYKCEYCWHWRKRSYADEMSLERWQAALLSLKSFLGRYVVNFLGGEPFVYKHFIELVEFCAKEQIDWGVITNGSALTKTRVSRLVAARPINFDVSVDAATEEIHDKVRGVNGSLDAISRGLRMLVRERNLSVSKFPIRIKTTVHRYNYTLLDKLVDWASEIGVTSIDFSPVRLRQSVERDRLYLRDSLEIARLGTIVNDLVNRKTKGAIIETSVPKLLAMPGHFADKAVNHGARNCRRGLRNYSIRANGDVVTCDCFAPIGNCRVTSARELWQSSSARQSRKLTLSCTKMATDPEVAMSCGAHRSLFQDIKRGIQLFARG